MSVSITSVCLISVCCLIGCLNAAPAIGNQLSDRDWGKSCWSDADGQATRWWSEGDTLTRGALFYECRGARLRAIGCIEPNSRRTLRIGETYSRERFELKCTSDNNGGVFFEQTACITQDGQRYSPGATWRVGDTYYTCEIQVFYNRRYLRESVGGCVYEGREYTVGQEMATPTGWWECRRAFTGTKMALVGCIDNGRRYNTGEMYEDRLYAYQCSTRDGQPSMEVVNCITDTQEKLNSGDRYFKDGKSFQCEILYNPDTSETTKNHTLVGCVETDAFGSVKRERVIGCQWYVKDTRSECNFEFICAPSGDVSSVGCTLTKDGFGFLFVPAGSYTLYTFTDRGERGIGCRRNGTDQMEYFEFDPEDVVTKSFGLRFSVPRGK